MTSAFTILLPVPAPHPPFRVALSFPLLLAFILHYAYRHTTGRMAEQLNHLAEANRLHLSTIEALAHAIDAKDSVTHDHIRRVQRTWQ